MIVKEGLSLGLLTSVPLWLRERSAEKMKAYSKERRFKENWSRDTVQIF